MMAAMRAVSVLCVALVAVAGCSSGGHHPKHEPSLGSSAARDIYLSSVAGLLPASYSDDDAINLAKAMCAALNAGSSYEALLLNQTGPGVVSADVAAKLIVSAVVSYCPKDLHLLPGGADGSS